MANEAQYLDYDFHALNETKEASRQDGVSVRHMLIIEAVRGICAGPLATRFASNPEQLGAFAAAIADGVAEVEFDASALSAD